jgi:hypothetical protein
VGLNAARAVRETFAGIADMLRATKYWIVCIAAVACGIALLQMYFAGPARTPSETYVGATKFSPSGVSQPPALASLDGHHAVSSSDPGVTVGQTEGAQGKPPPLPGTVDRSVIGIPFSISASIEARCRRDCDEVNEKLSEMVQEPRDSVWATEMEMKIQDNLTSQGSDKYSIRNIECRASLCAVETASLFGQYLGPAYNDPLNKSLGGGGLIPIWGYEFDPSGARVTVSLVVLMRRQ